VIFGRPRGDFLLAPDHGLHRLRRVAVGAAAVGVAASAVGAWWSPAQFYRSYLVAYLFWLGLALGSLAILMIKHNTGGAWGAIIRRLLESAARTMPLLALLFVPIALGVHDLYAWARPEVVAHDAVLQHKRVYLNVPFFLGRAVLYFVAWGGVAHFLARWSLAQDEASDDRPGVRLEQLSRGGLLLLGLTATFASVDWMMSLEPHWFSTIYGFLFMGGCVLSALAFAISMAGAVADRPPLSEIITPNALHDLGKLLLAFVMLWAYFSLSQFLIMWAGDLPEEVHWYVRRLNRGWQWLIAGIVAVQFCLPFVVLLSRRVKRSAAALTAVAVLLLAVRFADLFWLVQPAFDGGAAPRVHLLDAATLLGVGGLWLAVFVRQLEGRPLVPLRDPSLAEAP
jgi:hypothetical protein